MTDEQPIIRRLAPGAATELAGLEAEVFAGADPWPAAAFVSELSSPFTFYVGAHVGTQLVGYAGLARVGTEADPDYEVHTMAVASSYRGTGLGRKLLNCLLAAADENPGPVFLEVRVGNDPAIGLYEAAGFTTIGRREKYYQPQGDDAWVMRREPAPQKA
ncbi:ribosomal protein S18-alanine N-acetyltransferase [Corynebacterium sp. TAE3-ERU12]|uniref:ribosomal protein S18-alanine N-acetyltransferase n=1 Tax=Corynebacterium sp. TAE3-ERU12 TaxID=2849491 RepID=UPI001C44145C|nr:ribosomal protein S18-alanine N-acetyltransferase [Corynebacterium sp. TAE3-ERU12]MBV7294721.1 ribosomal protein S18-alanine N-acetyltransferase [Corynebacterium sp. TAE3-ERU12]